MGDSQSKEFSSLQHQIEHAGASFFVSEDTIPDLNPNPFASCGKFFRLPAPDSSQLNEKELQRAPLNFPANQSSPPHARLHKSEPPEKLTLDCVTTNASSPKKGSVRRVVINRSPPGLQSDRKDISENERSSPHKLSDTKTEVQNVTTPCRVSSLQSPPRALATQKGSARDGSTPNVCSEAAEQLKSPKLVTPGRVVTNVSTEASSQSPKAVNVSSAIPQSPKGRPLVVSPPLDCAVSKLSSQTPKRFEIQKISSPRSPVKKSSPLERAVTNVSTALQSPIKEEGKKAASTLCHRLVTPISSDVASKSKVPRDSVTTLSTPRPQPPQTEKCQNASQNCLSSANMIHEPHKSDQSPTPSPLITGHNHMDEMHSCAYNQYDREVMANKQVLSSKVASDIARYADCTKRRYAPNAKVEANKEVVKPKYSCTSKFAEKYT